MRTGQLNCRAAILYRAATQDALGQPTTAWTTFATVWANVKNNSGLSSIQGDAEISTVKASVRIRYRTDLNSGMRVLVNGITYDIKAVLLDFEGKEFTDLVCQQVI
ncbi:MAG: head-tail adaptor protein [Phenylobacterium zucineum]|nr:MAG: head-tail adaptor protein [Phenylobacterium zucineum]